MYTFGDPGRDPRGRTITVVYLTRLDADKNPPQAADDASEAGWYRFDLLPPLAFDHAEILAFVRRRLRKK